MTPRNGGYISWSLEREEWKEYHNVSGDIGAPLLKVMLDCDCRYCNRRIEELAAEGIQIQDLTETDTRRNFTARLRPDSSRKFRIKGATKPKPNPYVLRWNARRPVPAEAVIVSEDEVFRVGLEVENFRKEIQRTEHLLNIVIGDAQRKDLQVKLTELYYDYGRERAKFETLSQRWREQQKYFE